VVREIEVPLGTVIVRFARLPDDPGIGLTAIA
jgi:hypothetical protein